MILIMAVRIGMNTYFFRAGTVVPRGMTGAKIRPLKYVRTHSVEGREHAYLHLDSQTQRDDVQEQEVLRVGILGLAGQDTSF